MRQYAPNYYSQFRCIAGDCNHSCCIGWEIEIDAASYKRYQSATGPIGDRLRHAISTEDDGAHFILDPEERCPFLNQNNLCELILTLGGDALCDICSDHPRFRNYFDDREELGLGLCCEAAATLVLTQEEPVKMLPLSSDDTISFTNQDTFFTLRQRIFDTVQNRTRSIDDRIEDLFKNFGIDLPDRTIPQWLSLYHGLERLNEHWAALLQAPYPDTFPFCGADLPPSISLALEHLLVYFLYRHLADGVYDGLLYERAAFAILSMRMISLLAFSTKKPSLLPLIDIARQYSSEIEYSDQNITTLLASLDP